jgi:hypothetical protein
MRRALVALTVTLTLAACSPYDTPADAAPAATCDRACWQAVIERQKAERLWWAEAVAQQRRAADWRRLVAHLEATRYRPGQCGGSLPPCYVMHRESRGNIRAQNPRSTASGKWQFLDSTWRRIPVARGYAKARHAPEQVQDAAARWLWNGGRGCSHWNAC